MPRRDGETLHRAIIKLLMRVAVDQAKTVCESLQLCTGIEAGIEGTIPAMEQRRREKHAPELGGGADEGSEGAEDESVSSTSRKDRAEEESRVGGIGEVPHIPGEQSTVEEGERGEIEASNDIRTAMEGIEAGL